MRTVQQSVALLCCLLICGQSFGAFNANTQWEVRTAGNAANGGGFAYGLGYSNLMSIADLSVDASVNTKVTSASHSFVAGDVGKFVQVTAGTNWNSGYYQILTTASNAATLDRSPAPVGTTSGTYTLWASIDRSQQNAAQQAYTDLAIDASDNTQITSAAHPFVVEDIGNILNVTGGTNFTVQRAQITGAVTSQLSRAGWSIASVESQNPSFPASNILDGNNATIWSSTNGGSSWVIVNAGGSVTFSFVGLRTRGDGFAPDGNPKNFDIYVSDDGVTWGSPVASLLGVPAGSTDTYFYLGASYTKQYIKLVINSIYGAGNVVLAEFYCLSFSGKVICDKSLGTTGSTGGTGNLGGGLTSIGSASALFVSGNVGHVQVGTYTLTTSRLFVLAPTIP